MTSSTQSGEGRVKSGFRALALVALWLGASLLIGLCPWLLTNHINGSLQLLINRLPN